MCFNSPEIVAAVRKRAALIGGEIAKEVTSLSASGKAHLFAGVIAGWETGIGRDFAADRALGYRALRHQGFSAGDPPNDVDMERVRVVKEFMELWGHSLTAAGVPRQRVFCHIAFTDQGLRAADARSSRAERVQFALPEVAFSPAYRPGFSTYPEGATFSDIHAILARRGNPGWISAEGTNVSPTGMPGEPTMESYLGRMFNHGAVWVNLFSWGMGGDAMRDNFFRKATEGHEALAAYARFLRGAPLAEAVGGFTAQGFQSKVRRIQSELAGWARRASRPEQARATALSQRLEQLMSERQWQEADRVADQILGLMSR
ncbi:MAG: hypothetical protein NT029_20740 [Armatimonadetes bacterium]|nr:hypothetical protein [Armatimonadota bacterium]